MSGRGAILCLSPPAIPASIPWLVTHHLLAPSMTSPQKFSVLPLPSSGEAWPLRLAVGVVLHLLSSLVVGERTPTTVLLLVQFCPSWWIHLFSLVAVSCQMLCCHWDPGTLLLARCLCRLRGNHPSEPFSAS